MRRTGHGRGVGGKGLRAPPKVGGVDTEAVGAAMSWEI